MAFLYFDATWLEMDRATDDLVMSGIAVHRFAEGFHDRSSEVWVRMDDDKIVQAAQVIRESIGSNISIREQASE